VVQIPKLLIFKVQFCQMFGKDSTSHRLLSQTQKRVAALCAALSFGFYKYAAGSIGSPFARNSKCKCGPVEKPVEPTAAIG
jgi:hypothetical protein